MGNGRGRAPGRQVSDTLRKVLRITEEYAELTKQRLNAKKSEAFSTAPAGKLRLAIGGEPIPWAGPDEATRGAGHVPPDEAGAGGQGAGTTAAHAKCKRAYHATCYSKRHGLMQ